MFMRRSVSLGLLLIASVLFPARAFSQTWTNFQVGGLTRKALVYVPSGINAPPLLISLHGMGIGAGWNQGEMMKFEPIADRDKFIVVYPEADQNLRWDLGGTHDIDFILAIIDEMSTRHGIDRNRVYASGFSMGGMFSYTLACKIPDKIAAIAPGDGYPLGGESGCTKARPVPIFHMHGTADDFVKYSGIHAFLDTKIAEYGCPPTAVTTKPYPPTKTDSQSFKEYWGPCTNDNGQQSEIILISVTGMIHDWATAGKANANTDPQFAGKPFDIDGSEEAWAFLRTHSLTDSGSGGQSTGGQTGSGGGTTAGGAGGAGNGGVQSGGGGAGTGGSTVAGTGGAQTQSGGSGNGGAIGAIAGAGGGAAGGGTPQQGNGGAFPGPGWAPGGSALSPDSTGTGGEPSGCSCKVGRSSRSPDGLIGLIFGLSLLLRHRTKRRHQLRFCLTDRSERRHCVSMARPGKHTCALLLATGWLAMATPAPAAPGPGIGNVDCTDAEKFKPLVFLENTQGGPTGTNVVIMTGGYLMLNYANDSGGPPGILTFFDVSNPREPRSVRRIDDADTRQFRESHSFPIAIIDGKHYVAIQTIRGIQFWDVTDAATAARVGNIDLPGVNGGDYENVAWQASWQGRYLFVSGGNLGVFVVDAANPTQPRLVKTVPTGQSGGFRVGPLYALGDYLVISNMDQNGALGVLDISKADAPALLTTKSGLPRMYAFIVAGDRIYGAGRDGDFTIHSWTDPTRITDVKIARIEQDSLYVAAQDQFVFSGRQNNFVKIDLTDEMNPRIVGEGTLSRDHPDHGQVTPLGNLIYIGNDHGTGSALFCHQTGKDVTPPGILKVFPSDGSTHQPVTSRVTVSWSDYIDTRTVGPSTIAIRPVGGTALRGIYSYAFNTLSFGPDQPLASDTTYEIVISAGGVKDVMGNAVTSERVVRFSTGDSIDVPPPVADAGAGGSSSAGGTSSGGSISGGVSGTGGVSGSGGTSGINGVPGSGSASGVGEPTGGQYGVGGASVAGGGMGGQAAMGGGAEPNLGGPDGLASDDSGSCGCRTPSGSPNSPALTALIAVAILLWRRRA